MIRQMSEIFSSNDTNCVCFLSLENIHAYEIQVENVCINFSKYTVAGTPHEHYFSFRHSLAQNNRINVALWNDKEFMIEAMSSALTKANV